MVYSKKYTNRKKGCQSEKMSLSEEEQQDLTDFFSVVNVVNMQNWLEITVYLYGILFRGR